MRRVATMAITAASLIIASAVWADEPTPAATDPAAPAPAAAAPAPAKPKAKVDDPDRIVCTREHVVGSNRPEKVCMTVAERERLRDLARRGMDGSRGAGDPKPPGPSGPG